MPASSCTVGTDGDAVPSTTVEPPPVDEEPSRDDLSVEEESIDHDELLAKHLGAELIAEEE